MARGVVQRPGRAIARGVVRVGVGGWVFPAWNATFYPRTLRAGEHLHWASRQLTAIEINATYHRTQTPAVFANWRTQVPDGFRFAVKAARWATQTTDRDEAERFVQGFLASGVAELGDALGPVLWQMPPTRTYERAEWFADLLPATLEGLPLRHAIEAQHPSFDAPEAVRALRDRGVTRVTLESVGGGPPALPAEPNSFRYVRMKGSVAEEAVGYPAALLEAWAARYTDWAAAGDVYAFVIAGAKQRAPAAALALLSRVSGSAFEAGSSSVSPPSGRGS